LLGAGSSAALGVTRPDALAPGARFKRAQPPRSHQARPGRAGPVSRSPRNSPKRGPGAQGSEARPVSVVVHGAGRRPAGPGRRRASPDQPRRWTRPLAAARLGNTRPRVDGRVRPALAGSRRWAFEFDNPTATPRPSDDTAVGRAGPSLPRTAPGTRSGWGSPGHPRHRPAGACAGSRACSPPDGGWGADFDADNTSTLVTKLPSV